TQKFGQQPKALAPENLRSLGETSDVSARPRNARDDAKGDGIEHLNEYDRNILGRSMDSARLAGAGCNDHVRFQLNKFARKSRQARKIPIRPTPSNSIVSPARQPRSRNLCSRISLVFSRIPCEEPER